MNWHERKQWICNQYLLEHHVSYRIDECFYVYRRMFKCQDKEEKVIGGGENLDHAKQIAATDFEEWLGEL